jgi:hypothetical protein
MFARLRTVLLWILMTALPLQGWAAAAMLHCGPSHQRMDVTAPESGDHHDAAGSDHGHLADLGEVAASESHGKASHGSPSLAKFKCSACAACCLGLALPSMAPAFEPLERASTLVPPASSAPVVFLTGGQERPPRPFLA